MRVFKNVILASCIAALMASAGQAQASPDASAPTATAQHQFERAIAPIKSEADLQAYMVKHPGKDNPLNLLSKPALERFRSSLVFSSTGLTSFGYVDIESELTVSQLYSLLALFGQQQAIVNLTQAKVLTEDDSRLAAARSFLPQGAVLQGYVCYAQGTCYRNSGGECPISDCVTQLSP